MPFYVQKGSIPQKRHITFYKPDGKSLYREELFSTSGFSGIYSNRYRLRMPTRVLKIEEQNLPKPEPWKNVPLKWHLFHTERYEAPKGDFFSARENLLWNDHIWISTAKPSKASDAFYKNAFAHELIFVHKGQGIFWSEFGQISFTPGD